MVVPGSVLLWWLPVGAGGHVAVRTSRWWEVIQARREHRRPGALLHSALEVTVGDTRYVIEMAPAWGGPAGDRGVVAEGPVGVAHLQWCPLFRYEVRCWADGRLSDIDFAVDGPVPVSADPRSAARIVESVSRIPMFTWGRDELHAGDMWNSNSLVSWLLQDAGHDARSIRPPAGGRAPGWDAGIVAASACAEPRSGGDGVG